MKKQSKPLIRCAVYTRKSSEEGLEQAFNSLDAQREACESYIHSQRHEGWNTLTTPYKDGGFSGGNMDRPALANLLTDIKSGNIDVIVVYKVDRLSRSLADFVRLIELFDNHNVSFVSVTQQFNTSSSMGRLTLNVLLSFAQFEREVTSERIRDKIAASKQKGMWMGGRVPIGYDVLEKLLVVNESEAITVRHIYDRYLDLGCVRKLKTELDADGYVSKARIVNDKASGEKPFSRGSLYALIKNPIYIGKTHHKGTLFDGQHAGIVDPSIWQQAQERITRNKHLNQTRTLAKDPSLLAGLIFDDKQHPMSPTHTRKHNRRYRYYVSQAALQFQENETGSVIRIAAQVIESLVVNTLMTLLSTAATLLDAIQLDAHSANDVKRYIEHGNKLATSWKDLSPSEHINLLNQIIHRITLGNREMSIVFSRRGLRSVIAPELESGSIEEPSPNEDQYTVVKSVYLKRCGIETKLIIAGEPTSPAHPETVQAIQNALAKALKWNDALVHGQVSSIKAIATQENVTSQFITRRIKLAYLSPDIMEAIFKGEIPHTLSMGLLEKSIPLNWEHQRGTFGFAS
ncbi:MAG: recombinase family protein [Gammaproteobacteria bacterium]|nr:recombinase family protein [Gammaproteobacteria bacterium]